ncbi:MAG: RdgB/HAM1 family non-canonical purine NTP pyrophosphatase [Phycisphaerae bacterium]|nr:RdgB/HAM1 family non-canonical purine NTP pyrophosphatase [Phycisphaerae bacterium]
MSRTVVLATRNPGKIREIAAVLGALGISVIGLDDWPDVPEPAENGATFGENARHKARYYANATGLWCLADDSGLVVDALDGAPGVFSARYASDRCEPAANREILDKANNAKLLEALADIPEEKRIARFVCHLALADGDKILLEAKGAIEGQIGFEEMGANGFGYDPLFFVPEKGCTTAQMSPETKNDISHRGKAVRQLAEQLGKMPPGTQTN